MDRLIYLHAAVVMVAAALASISIRAPRPLWIKIGALLLAALLMPIAYGGFVELLGRPKPVWLEWPAGSGPAATVLAARMHEPKAIYVWLQYEGNPEPRAYRLPWSLDTAKQLQQALRDASASGTAARMRRPSDATVDQREPIFYAEPQPALPPKTPLPG